MEILALPASFTAITGTVPQVAWVLFIATIVWALVYDTQYAMVDREDDLKIGIKSSAILFGEHDRLIIAVLQVLCLLSLYLAGQAFGLGTIYQTSLLLVAALFCYHQYLIRERDPAACFRAFLHNNWVGMTVFFGIALDYAL